MFSSFLLANDLGELMNEELLPDPVPLFGSLFGDELGLCGHDRAA